MNYIIQILLSLYSACEINNSGFVSFNCDEVEISHHSNMATITLPFEVLEEYFIQSDKIEGNRLRATQLVFESNDKLVVMDHSFSVPQYDLLALNNEKLMVIRDDFDVNVEVKFLGDTNNTLRGKLYYQAWNGQECYFPRVLEFEVSMHGTVADMSFDTSSH